LAATSCTRVKEPTTTIRLPTCAMSSTFSVTVVELSRICGVRPSGSAETTEPWAGPALAVPVPAVRVVRMAAVRRPQTS
jgi:hypothetical protein